MTIKYVAYVSLVAAALACGYCLYLNEIVILWPRHQNTPRQHQLTTQYKLTPVWLYKDAKWKSIMVETIWDGTAPRYAHLVQNVLDTLYQERIMQKKIVVEFAQTNNSGGILYIQFNRNPFDADAPVRLKCQIIDSILKTMSVTQKGINSVAFLVGHSPLIDQHLDFTDSWPIASLLSRS